MSDICSQHQFVQNPFVHGKELKHRVKHSDTKSAALLARLGQDPQSSGQEAPPQNFQCGFAHTPGLRKVQEAPRAGQAAGFNLWK